MTEAMPFLQKYDITFLRPPTIRLGTFFVLHDTPQGVADNMTVKAKNRKEKIQYLQGRNG